MTTLTPQLCRTARAWLDWTQEDLAKVAKVGITTIRDFERNARKPFPETIDKLTEALKDFPGVAKPLLAEEVEWVVNNLAELGVKIGDQFFWLYKGGSLVYSPGEKIKEGEPDEQPIKWRLVGKREFGETCKPLLIDREQSRIGHTVLKDVPYPYIVGLYDYKFVDKEEVQVEVPWRDL